MNSAIFNSNLTLENQRVKLVPLGMEHFDSLLPFAINEPELWTYSLTPGNGEKNLKKYMEMAVDKRAQEDSYPFVVIDKLSNEVAGSTRYYDIQQHHRTLQLGYTWYGKKFQGTGLNKNCKFLLLEHAFEQLEMERVEFRADKDNALSIAAMKSIGCVEEGILRSNCMGIDARRSSIVLSILKDEWFNTVKANLLSRC